MKALMIALLFSGIADRARPPASPAGSGTTAPAPERSDAEVREQVTAYLSTIDVPIHFDQWKSLGARATPMLEEVAYSADQMPTRRAKALEGLAAVPARDTANRMLELARAEKESSVVRLTALRAAGRLVPSNKLVTTFRPFLNASPDPRIRSTAAEVLARHAPAHGCREIRAQVAREKEDALPQFKQALEKCRAPAEPTAP